MATGAGSDLPKLLFEQIVKPSADWWRFYKENNHVEGQVTQLANITGLLEALRVVAANLNKKPEDLLGTDNAQLLYVAKLAGGMTQPTVAALHEYFQKQFIQAQQDLRALKDGGGSATASCTILPTCLTDDSALSRIIGQEDAVKQIETGFIYPLLYPSLFPTLAKGILLYGPPGTGKTALVRAAVNDLARKTGAQIHFFLANPADLKGKYLGESEKQIRQLFDCAQAAATASSQEGLVKDSRVVLTVDQQRRPYTVRKEVDGVYYLTLANEKPDRVSVVDAEKYKEVTDDVVENEKNLFWVTGDSEKRKQPVLALRRDELFGTKYNGVNTTQSLSVIFMDEVDSVAGTREGDASGLRATTVNALLQEMDGVAAKPNVVVMAATNYPWKLDDAFLRRMTKKIMMTIPDSTAIQTKFEQLFLDHRKAVLDKISTESQKLVERKKHCEKPNVPPAMENWLYKNDEEFGVVKALSEKMKDKYTLDDVEKVVREAARLAGEDALDKNSFRRLNLTRMPDKEKEQYAWLVPVLNQGEDIYVPTMEQDEPAEALKNLFAGDMLCRELPDTFAILLNNVWFVTAKLLPSFLKPTGFITEVFSNVGSYVKHALDPQNPIEFLVRIDLFVKKEFDEEEAEDAEALPGLIQKKVTEKELTDATNYTAMVEKTGITEQEFENFLKSAKNTPDVRRSVYLKGSVNRPGTQRLGERLQYVSFVALLYLSQFVAATVSKVADPNVATFLEEYEEKTKRITVPATPEQQTQVTFITNATDIYVPWLSAKEESANSNKITPKQKKILIDAILNDGILLTNSHPLSRNSMVDLVDNVSNVNAPVAFLPVQKPKFQQNANQTKEEHEKKEKKYYNTIQEVIQVISKTCREKVCGNTLQTSEQIMQRLVDENKLMHISQRGLIVPHIDVIWIEKVINNPAMKGNVNLEKIKQIKEYEKNPAAYIEKVHQK